MKQKSILLLDDDADSILTFQIALEIEGFKVVAFQDPVEAIDYFKTNSSNFYLIITDMKMPKMNGIEFAYRIRQIDKKVKIWLTTAFVLVSMDNNPLFNFTKIEKVIEKPVQIDKLVDMVKSTINY